MDILKLDNVSLKNVNIKDCFWNDYIDLIDDVIIPFQWELINDNVEGAEKSYCIRNFKIAAGEIEGEHKGMVFQDTDVAKWLEAVAFSLAKNRRYELEKIADDTIELIAKVQCEDGYLNTYYTIKKIDRWSDLFEGHELYTAGHFIEAAVAYYLATGKDKLLRVMCKFCDYIYDVFGNEKGKINGYPGHPEIELALIKLYRVTKNNKYLKLADYFIKQRGVKPCYFLDEDCIKNGNYIFSEFKYFQMDYCQAHLPLEEQVTAEGHAVRAVYLYCAMADLAYENSNLLLLKQCESLWKNIVERRMYITGSIGSAAQGERFTSDYDLPNNTNYSESCATIGLAMFSNRMFQITKDAKYIDVVERCLYNTLLAGISNDGKHFFYVNPLEVFPEIVEKNPTLSHVMTTRQNWFGVACCPPNIARTLASLSDYIYAKDNECLYINLFISSNIECEINEKKMLLCLKANYPEDGLIKISVDSKNEVEGKIAIRKPDYVNEYQVVINGKIENPILESGYLYIDRKWHENDIIEIILNLPFRYVRCNPKVRDNIGKVAVMKGPLVYCLEEIDNSKYLSSIIVDVKNDIKMVKNNLILNGIACAEIKAKIIDYNNKTELLYLEEDIEYVEKVIKLVPYCKWNNRDRGEMIVWMREKI